MKKDRPNTEEENQQIKKTIKGQVPIHHLFHRQIYILIKLLEEFLTRNKGTMELPQLKEMFYHYWEKYHGDTSEKVRLMIWFCHFRISKQLLKQRKEDNLKPHDLTGGHSHTPLRTLKDINEYYAVAGVLMAVKETDIAGVMGGTIAKLNRILEQQIPVYYTAYPTQKTIS